MAAEIISDPWSTLDDILGLEVADVVDDGIGATAVARLMYER